MIDIEKLLRGPHITLRFYGLFHFHNMCGFGRCRHVSCKNCPNTKYYILFGKSKREYLLPDWIQRILRKCWD